MSQALTTESLANEVVSYKLYNGQVELFYDDVPHVYFRINEAGERVDVAGVTTVLGTAIDKSYVLMRWATKLCVETLRGHIYNPDGTIRHFTADQFEMWLNEAKNKHSERLEEAGNIGHIAHKAIEDEIIYAIKHNHGVVNTTYYRPYNNLLAQSCYEAALKWMKLHNVRWIYTERKIYSRKFDVAGTTDGVCLVDSCGDPECKGCQGRTFKDRLSIADWKSSNHLSDSYAYQAAIYLFAMVEETGMQIQDRWILRLGKTDGDFEPWYLGPEWLEADTRAFVAALELYRSLKSIEERRSADKRERRAALKAEKQRKAEEEKAAKKLAAKQKKEDKRLAKEAADRKYKELRAGGMPVKEAKLLAYPNVVPRIKGLLPAPASEPIQPTTPKAATREDMWAAMQSFKP
jgi:hypothetical protein